MAETQVVAPSSAIKLRPIAAFSNIRVLAWDGDVLYGCRGYDVVRLRPERGLEWDVAARFRPAWWRSLTSRNKLSYRLVRDGFHALAILSDGTMVGAVPGALVTKARGGDWFEITHRISRGTRPLHVTSVPSGNVYWGEYFDNRERSEVHLYASSDRGQTWEVAHVFPAGSIRHVHNIVYDGWQDCLWILTGDDGNECKVMRASCDLQSIETVLSGNQQTRAVAAIPTPSGLYLSTDTPFEKNHVYRLDPAGNIELAGDLGSSSVYGCRVGKALFFSTMAEPSAVNTTCEVQLAGARDGRDWQVLAQWKKDRWPMRYLQYGNAFLPDGENATPFLAATTIGVSDGDLVTTLWEVETA